MKMDEKKNEYVKCTIVTKRALRYYAGLTAEPIRLFLLG